jgi:hypothetical protein
LAASAEAARLDGAAAAASQAAKDANERADNYMLAVVLFASSLFFGGLSARLETRGARLVTLGLGCVVFLGTAGWLATLPVHV